VGLQLDQPLFLIMLVPVVVVLYLFWKTSQAIAKIEKYTIMIIRLIVFMLLILALTLPQILYPIKGISTVFVLDRSESVKNQEGSMYAAVEEAVSKMAPEDRYAIVTVAEDARIGQSLSSRETGIAANELVEDRSYTNLADGLQLASSLFSDEMNGRIVLLSDGNENIGDVKEQVKILGNQQIPVDVLPFYPVIDQDISIEEFEIPTNLYQGENAALSITLSSTTDKISRLKISKDNETIINEELQLKEGKNSYSFKHLIDSPGFHTFKAEIIDESDGISQNNQYFAISNASGIPTVLLVEGHDMAGVNISNALQASKIDVTTIKPELLPTTLAGYLEYESIIFSNVSATDITEKQMDMIESAVKEFGVGFVMTGGNKSYGLGGYFKTPIERLLPVEMDLKGKKELPSLGMIIVMDRSGSMSGYKLDLAKEAAARSVELLRDKDTFGFIAFDDRPWQIIETGPLKDKEEVADTIRSITEGGGTEIFTSLQQAYEQLSPLQLQRKHIILLTDGQSATSGNYVDLIAEGLENNVTLSTVAIGSDADRSLLEQLATEGTGRFYDVQDASTIPSILSRETVLTTRTYIEDNPFYPAFTQGSRWSELFNNGVPQMNVYVATDPKDRAEITLVSGKEDPILTSWKYGLGRSIAWTSDASGEWAGEWPKWSNWSSMWNDMITWTFPSYQHGQYDISQEIHGKNVTLEITSSTLDSLPMVAAVLDESGNEIEVKTRAIAPGKYEVTFSADTGVYYLQLSKQEGEEITDTFKTGIVVPYSKEFEMLDQNNSLLTEIAKLGGGEVLTSAEEAFRDISSRKYEKQSFSMPLLLLAFLLFFIEIAIRRFGITPLVERVRLIRRENVGKQKEKQNDIKQTYVRLKKASTQPRRPVVVKESKLDESKKALKQSQSSPSETVNRKSEVSKEQFTENEDRLKRLLDAKKRRRR